MSLTHRSIAIDGMSTHYLDAGEGEAVVLLHGGEFGAGAEIAWEKTIPALAAQYRVLAPDMLGFGDSAKVMDFTDGRGFRIRHIARFCEALGVESAHFIGNSMGAINLLTDLTANKPVLPVRTAVAICGGGDIQQNRHTAALYVCHAIIGAQANEDSETAKGEHDEHACVRYYRTESADCRRRAWHWQGYCPGLCRGRRRCGD